MAKRKAKPRRRNRVAPGKPKLTYEQYNADTEAVRKTWLDYIDRSPAHLRAYLDGKLSKESPAMDLGSLVHSWCLEPDSVQSRYLRIPKLDRRRKADKALYAELIEQADEENKILIDDDMWIAAEHARDAVFAHKTAKNIFSKGEPEATVIWEDPGTGELCKARADWLRENFLTDVKTTRDASPEAFARSVVNYRYDVQDFWYRSGFDSPGMVFVCVETEYPFSVAVYADNPALYELGKRKAEPNLETYAECKAKGEWPGYPDHVQPIVLPPWAMRE